MVRCTVDNNEGRGEDLRKQKNTLKKMISVTAMPFTAKPAFPNQNGPLGMFFLPVSKCGRIASAYEAVVRIMKEPTRSVKAVLLPSWMAPKAVQSTPAKMVEWMGQLSLSLTRLKKGEKGTALSRARAHQMRPTWGKM